MELNNMTDSDLKLATEFRKEKKLKRKLKYSSNIFKNLSIYTNFDIRHAKFLKIYSLIIR